MKIMVSAFLMIIASAIAIAAQVPPHNVEGNWLGTLDVGGVKLRLVLKIQKATNGYAA